ncbi:M1 family metallopeptidase [Actinomadura hibisca]|uniref:M1 family metallopeptidase n=1 Tax=Actinomadura hibisca TaxID=68565 RepID=UPI00082D2904|nr:M1 family metallopeptidase [Actinomadura hibisca]
MGNTSTRIATRSAGVAVSAAVVLAGGALTGAAQAAPPHAGPGSSGVGDPYYPEYGNGGYDVSHYGLKLKYQPATDRLDGTATVTARTTQALTSFNLDFGLKVTGVTVNGRRAAFRTASAHELVITPARPLRKGQRVTTVVTYGDTPGQVKVSGITSWHRSPDGGAVAANEPESAWWWFPSNDHPTDKATYDVSVTVPDGYQAVSNGRATGTRRAGGWTRYDWREHRPQASYLATLAVGKFDVTTSRAPNGLPVVNAYSRDLPADVRKNAQQSLERSAEVVQWGSKVFGPYPFDALGGYVPNVKAGFALETQTRPFYSPAFFRKGPNVDVVVHELAHQWFGDSVSLRTWRDIWLNEGFASYAEWLWSEQHGGDSAQKWADRTYAQYAAGDKFWQVKPGDPGAANQFHGAVYDRGALAVHALRAAVGDRDFFRIVRSWTAAKRNGTATIEEFVAHAERVSGERLDQVFRTWLFTPGRPAKGPGH